MDSLEIFNVNFSLKMKWKLLREIKHGKIILKTSIIYALTLILMLDDAITESKILHE
jgi:hypothetical protein